jgi:hypothetical protein
MEYSCYYYYSNQTTEIIAFVKKDDMIDVRFLNYETFPEDYDYDDDEQENNNNFHREVTMIISYEQLKELKSLYNYYLLSLMLTKNPKELKYVQGERMSGWAISANQNWKGLYFTEIYKEKCYVFDNKPKELIIDNVNLNNTVINYYKNKNETKKELYNSIFYLLKFIDKEEKKIEKELIQLEHIVAKQKISEMFASRIKVFINDDTYRIILKKLL